jgi:hypothetical protein
MGKTISLPNNFIGKHDREKLESFGGHTIAHGRATRWHWAKNADGDDVFELYRGGENEVLAARILRDREHDVFSASDGSEKSLASGTLEHLLAELERYFASLHGEQPDLPA